MTLRVAWALCPYVNNRDACLECLEWENDLQHGKVMRGCVALALEAAAVAAQAMADDAERERVLSNIANADPVT